MKNIMIAIMLVVIVGCFNGCARKQMTLTELYTSTRPEWIRNGEPIEYEGEPWYPTDITENLLDREMDPLGEFRGVVFFIEKKDVKPFQRLYTKFGPHEYRVFLKKPFNR